MAASPRSSAASAPSARTGITSTPRGNSGGIDASVGAKEATSPIRVPAATASAIIASFGLSTGRGAWRRATASMQGPKAEQVKRIASAPVATA